MSDESNKLRIRRDTGLRILAASTILGTASCGLNPMDSTHVDARRKDVLMAESRLRTDLFNDRLNNQSPETDPQIADDRGMINAAKADLVGTIVKNRVTSAASGGALAFVATCGALSGLGRIFISPEQYA